MNKFIFLPLVLLLLVSFGYREPGYCKMANRIVASYVKEFAQPRRLALYGYGGAMMNDIQEITMRFFSSDPLNVDKARKLYVEMMEEFLQRINSHEKIRPHLHDYPFEFSNTKLTISFIDSQGHTRKDGHVALMFIGKNHTLYYEAYNSDTEEFYTLHKENYGEALRVVQTDCR